MIGLLLTRKQGESIALGDDVFIRVESVRQGRVKLRIVGPEDVHIYRPEIHPPSQRKLEKLGLDG